MIQTIRKLKNTLMMLREDTEVLIKDVENDTYLKIENVSVEKVESDPVQTRYIVNCTSAGNGCIAYK